MNQEHSSDNSIETAARASFATASELVARFSIRVDAGTVKPSESEQLPVESYAIV